MLYLVLAILMSTGVILTFRVFNRYTISNMQAIAVNYIIATWACWFTYTGDMKPGQIPAQEWFYLAFIIGVLFIIGFNLFALSSQKAGVAVTGVSSRMSVLIPTAFGILFLHEEATILKITGIILVLLSFYLIFKRDKTLEVNTRYLIFPIMLFMVNGANDTMISFGEKTYLGQDNNKILLFLAVIFGVSLVLSFLIVAYNVLTGKRKLATKNMWAGIILGLLNFGSTYFFLKALSVYDVSVVVPVQNVSIVSLSAIIGLVAFREKLRKINWIGIAMAIIAILIIAIARTS